MYVAKVDGESYCIARFVLRCMRYLRLLSAAGHGANDAAVLAVASTESRMLAARFRIYWEFLNDKKLSYEIIICHINVPLHTKNG